MDIAAKLDEELKAGMRARAKERVDCIQSVRAKVQETTNAKDFSGEVDDALYQKVIGAYVKSLKKGITELEAAGERSAELRGKYQVEIDYLSPLLPQMLDEAATRALVEKVIADQSIADPKQAGRVVGAVMKDHKGLVDPGVVKRLADEILSPS